MRAIPVPEGAEGFVTAHEFAPEPNGAESPLDGADDRALRSPFAGVDLDDVDIADEPPWLIDKLMPATGLAVVYGLPKSGKSFLVADAVLHVVMGRPWAGRAVLAGSAVYCAGEGVSGIKRRLVAFRRHHGIEGQGLPFHLIPTVANLGSKEGDSHALVEAIRAWHGAQSRPPIRAIVIDTLSRSMRGADENTAKDMGVFVDNCERIARAFGCIVVVVHHAGKDLDRGARGSTVLPAASDCMWLVEKGEAVNTVTVAAMKDGEDGLNWRFRLAPYVFGENGAGEEAQPCAASTCTVEFLSEPEQAEHCAAKRSPKLPDGPKMLLGIVRGAIAEAGNFVKGEANVPPGAKAVSRKTLKTYLVPKGYWDDDHSDAHNRANLSKHLKALATRSLIGLTGDFVWLTERA